MRIIGLAALFVGALVLAGCGSTRTERVVTGAAGGAVAGQVIGGAPLAGAAVGGTVGALR